MTYSPYPRKPLQPTLKAPSTTAQATQVSAVVAQNPAKSRTSSRNRNAKNRHDAASADYLSEKATISLIRRVLVSESNHGLETKPFEQSIEAILPPLTSSNEVDLQLYAIVAVIVKGSVNAWYSKITPDHNFVDEIIQIIAHCSRAIEQRVRRLDLAELVLDEIPTLLERHIYAYRTAKSSQELLSSREEVWQIYAILKPHPALQPPISGGSQHQTESTYRQLLVQGALAVLLPTEDVQNACLRILVSDIIADLILGRAFEERLCEGWFMHETISKLAAYISSELNQQGASENSKFNNKSRLEQFGLLSSKTPATEHHSPRKHQSFLSVWIWRVLQGIYFAYLSLRFVLVGLVHARHAAHRIPQLHSTVQRKNLSQSPKLKQQTGTRDDQIPIAVLSYRAYSTFSTLLDASIRMPWLVGALNFWQYILVSAVGQIGGPNSLLDKFLYNTIQTHVFTSSLAPRLLINLRSAIFPGNTLGTPAPPAPSEEEATQIRRQAAEDLIALFPPFVTRSFFRTNDHLETVQQVEEDILDVFGDRNMNKHLLYDILELLIVRLVPELAEKTTTELLAERGVDLIAESEKEDAKE